jgi:putative transposase
MNETYVKIICDSIIWHRQNKRFNLYAYVIMPNHIHLLIKPCKGYTISQNVQSFGSYTSHALVDEFKRKNDERSLKMFTVETSAKDSGSVHQIWQKIQAKNISTQHFLRQKLEYLHNNPVTEKWLLVDQRSEYKYSSASFYDDGKIGLIEVDNVTEFLS